MPEMHPKLRSSAISPEVASARGYETLVDDEAGRARLTALGFGGYVPLPGLLIPIQPPGSTTAEAYQFRPDTPRIGQDGKARKYENPEGHRLRVDVPAGARAVLTDSSAPLLITEGTLKADAVESVGQPAISFPGVWGWRRDSKPNPDLRKIEWGGRTAYLAFDSDTATNENVQQAEDELAKYLTKLGAVVKVLRLPPGPENAKQGLDDYLAADHTRDDLLALELQSETRLRARPIVEPTQPVRLEDALELWEEARETLDRFVVFQRQEDLDAVALWAMHTWAIGAADTTLYLFISSPLPECGKTRLLDVLELLTWNGIMVVIPTAPSVFRLLDAAEAEGGTVTLLLDELDKVYTHGQDRSELTGVFNQGYRRSGRVPRNVGTGLDMRVKMFPVFCPKAFAGIEKARELLPDTVRTRSVSIRLHKRSDEAIDRFLLREVEQDTAELRGKLRAWAGTAVPVLRDARPLLPNDDSLTDRQLDCWEPLFAIADLVGPEFGGKMRKVAVVLHRKDDEEEMPRDLRLIRDGAEAFSSDKAEAGKLLTEDLIDALVRRCAKDEDAPWADLWGGWHDANRRKSIGKQIAKMLKPYGVGPPAFMIVNGKRARGYKQEDFEKARRRWL